MNIVRVAVIAAAVVCIGQAAWAEQPSQAAGTEHRVVMHVDAGDGKTQRGVLNNVKNLFEALEGETLALEVVAHGAGLSLFVREETKLARELADLKQRYGVKYTACSNTMKARNLTRKDLIDDVDRTSPAMARLMELQEQGWVYIKP